MTEFDKRGYDLNEKLNKVLKDTTTIVQIASLIVLILIVLR